MANRSSIRWACILGFALGGFFDGILLHQILQWHHLLSLVPGVESIRAQVLWDGYFHALMYLVAAVGLWGLWRGREDVQKQPASIISGALLFGFGTWHVVDALLSHWVLGIHRVRLDSPTPLVWDMIWFVVFGVIPLAAGWLLMGKRRSPPIRGNSSFMVVPLIGLVTAGLAAWSMQPASGQALTTVVFAPGVRAADAMNAIVANGGRLVWSDPKVSVALVDVPEDRRKLFYRHGALLVSSSAVPLGCFSWSRS